MYELAAEEGGADDLAEADAELTKLREDIEAMEVRTLLSGEYDEREALVNIRSGAGGVDAADWAEMLMRMYIRWAEKHNYSVEVFDTSYAEEAGIKSATFAVHAPFAYGTLSVEQGTHRLVRISPFDNQGRRQTSFAEVEVLPVTETTDHIDIPEADVRVDVYRSSGPGGQSVNTTDSAVRLTHIPTGIVVTCQNEKSQLQNKVSAMRVLQAKLLERKRLEERAELDALKGDGGSSWGNQMRSYVLHPHVAIQRRARRRGVPGRRGARGPRGQRHPAVHRQGTPSARLRAAALLARRGDGCRGIRSPELTRSTNRPSCRATRGDPRKTNAPASRS